jgi:IS1 family transposase
VAQLDELETFVGKKNKIWLWTAVNKGSPGILALVLGDTSADEHIQTPLENCQVLGMLFYVTDGYGVYPCFINDADQIVNKLYMLRVEGENTRLRNYLARLHRQTLCYSKSGEIL